MKAIKYMIVLTAIFLMCNSTVLAKSYSSNDLIEESSVLLAGAGRDDDASSSSSSTYWNEDSFCTGGVLSVFKIIGYVVFTVKVLVPILLIVMGSIDLAKAVMSGKPDDQISKSVRSFVYRIIAGIIVFLVPSIITIVLELVGGESMLSESSGTFAKCTYCIFNPTSSTCDTD